MQYLITVIVVGGISIYVEHIRMLSYLKIGSYEAEEIVQGIRCIYETEFDPENHVIPCISGMALEPPELSG